ncbi:MAG: chromate transporter [Clostridia bacterium]|nr:chromate transporter [Clostridia bacterium]
MKRSPKLYLKLFLSTLQLSAFTFGGGYVIVSFLQKKFVDQFKWINKEEMLDIVAISQSSPGAIAINASILIGYRIGGVLGALCTLLGTILPPLVIISIISFFYTAFKNSAIVAAALKAMQAGIAAVVVDVIYKMSRGYFKDKDYLSLALMAAAFALSVFLNINVIFIILGGIAFGVFLHFLDKRKLKKNTSKELTDQGDVSVNAKEVSEENRGEGEDDLS